MNLKKQLFRLNCLGFFTCLRISDAVWVALLAARGYRLWEIGAAEGIFHVVSLLFEIPSGMAADLLGRRRSLAAAGLCGVLSGLLMALEQGFGWICLAMVFSALACNFVSGSDEALLYDSLLQTGKQEQYLQVNLRYTQMQNAGGLVSNMASMLTQAVNYTGFYLIDAAVGVLRMVAALGLEEPAVTQRQRNRGVQSLSTLARELKRHIRETAVALGENRRMREYMLADGILSLPGFLTLMFLQQRLTEFGLSSAWLGLPVICIALSRMIGVSVGVRLKVKKLRKLYAVCGLIVGFGTIMAGLMPLHPAIFGAMLAAAGMEVWLPHFQKSLNEQAPSDQRATLVSVNAMFYSVLMVIASPATGWLGDLSGSAGMGLAALGGMVFALAGIFSHWFIRN